MNHRRALSSGILSLYLKTYTANLPNVKDHYFKPPEPIIPCTSSVHAAADEIQFLTTEHTSTQYDKHSKNHCKFSVNETHGACHIGYAIHSKNNEHSSDTGHSRNKCHILYIN
jgi:hypothetical protein